MNKLPNELENLIYEFYNPYKEIFNQVMKDLYFTAYWDCYTEDYDDNDTFHVRCDDLYFNLPNNKTIYIEDIKELSLI